MEVEAEAEVAEIEKEDRRMTRRNIVMMTTELRTPRKVVTSKMIKILAVRSRITEDTKSPNAWIILTVRTSILMIQIHDAEFSAEVVVEEAAVDAVEEAS